MFYRYEHYMSISHMAIFVYMATQYGDHPNYYIIENGQNTEKSSGDLRRLAITQTPVKDHQLKLMWETLKE